MSRRPRRRQRPSPTRPSILPALEQFEPRYFPNDLMSLLGASVLGGGLAFLGQTGTALPRREPREGDGGASVYSPDRPATPAEPPVVPAPLPPIHYQARPENAGQVAMIPTPPAGQDVVPPLVKGLDDAIRYDPQPGDSPVHGVHLPDDPPTGNGTGFAVASTTGEGGGASAAPPAVPPADFGNFLSPPTTQPPHAPAAPTIGGGAHGGAAPASGSAPPAGQASPSNGPGAQAPPSLAQAYAKLPLTFEANYGQTDKSVNYLARGPGYTLFLGNNDVNLSLERNATPPGGPHPPASVMHDNLAIHFAGADPTAKVVGSDDLPSRSNYFTGATTDPTQSDIPNFGQVQVVGLYHGVDATYFGNAQGQLEYDLTVAPGADPSVIQLDFKGLRPLTIDQAGNLQLRTVADTGTVVHQAPLLYQTVNGVRHTVTGRYVLENAHTAGFQIDSYDPTLPLVIDPVLVYSTYLGGSGTDAALGVAVDNAGQAYLTGYTTSTDFPTQNPFQSSNAGSTNAFVAKFGPTGSLIYASYLGGNGTDEGTGIAVDLAGNAYLAGTTTSTNFPTSSGAYQTTTNDADSFAAKLNATGDALEYASYLGGSGNHMYYHTNATAIAVSPTGSAYVTGVTTDSSFPITVGAYKTSIGGSSNGFVVALNAAGTGASYATFLGGSTDGGNGIALDGAGDVFVTGNTNSGYPTSVGAYQTTYGLGTQDAFITELNPSGSAQVYSTYLGGGTGDYAVGNGIAVDHAGNAYVVGSASATGFPTTGGAYQTSYGGGSWDAFVSKLNKAGSALSYSTFLGGSGEDLGTAIAVDLAGEATVTGQTYSTNFPTQNALSGQGSLPGTAAAFATRLNAAGSGLVFSSYLGGNGTDAGAGVATDLLGALYVVGQTTSTNFPTQNAFKGTNAGGTDAFLAKILVAVPPPVFTGVSPDTGSSGSDQITTNQNLTISGTATPTSTVNLSRSDKGVIATGITTNATTGVWSYDYSGTTLAEGTYAFTATATLSGSTSNPSHAFLVTVDRTAPTVTLTVPATTTSEGPQARVTVYDQIGVPASATVSIDVDLDNDSDFTDAHESGYASGTLVNGVALITLYNAAAVLTSGNTYHVRARVTDLAGNEGTSSTQSLQVTTVGSPWTMTGQVLRGDPEAGNSQLQLGNLSLSHPLNVDQSGGSQSGGLALVYNSSETNVQPVIQVAIQSDNAAALPATITAQLTWAGGTAQTAVSYSTTGYYPGDVLTVAQQVSSAVSTTGRYGWSMKISITGRSDVTVTGAAYVVVEDSSPYSAGWTLNGVDQLYSISADSNGPAGMLRVYGSGGWRFYTDAGGGAYTSPAEDTGTLAKSGSTYTYTTPDGTVATFNSSGLETSVVSPDGNETLAYRYNGSSALTGMTSIDGALATFAYSSGLLSTVSAPGLRTYTLNFSGTNLTKVTDPDGGLRTFSYDGNHHLTGETNSSLVNAYGYDATFGTLASVTYGNGTVTTHSTLSPAVVQGLAAPSTGSPTLARNTVQATQTDDLGYATTYALDSGGRTLQELDPNGALTAYTRDSAGMPLTVTDPVGRVTSYAYDAKEYVTLTTLPDSSTIQDAYQTLDHLLTQETDARGGLTTYSYDSSGHQTLMVDPTGARTTSTYTGGGLLQTVKDPLNHVTTYAYDSDRRLTAVTNALLGIATSTYDNNGNVATSVDPLNHTTTYSNDVMGRTTLTTDPLSHTTSVAFDGSGMETSSTDQLGHVSKPTYDTTGRGLTVKDESAVGTANDSDSLTSYDADGRATATRDADGAWGYTYYDAAGQVTKTVNAQGATTQTDYDLDGEVVASRDALGRWSLTAYNSRGEATLTTDPLGNSTTYAFDPAGNLTQTTDPLGHTTKTGFDLDGRVTTQTDQLNHTVTTTYDLAGNVSTVTDARGSVTSYSYDALNRQTLETDAVGTGRQVSMTTAYDAVGNVMSSTDGLGHITSFAYDALNRQTSTSDSLGHTSTTAFDPAGNATAVTDELGKTFSNSYDALNRETGTTDPNSNTSTTILDPRGATVGTIDAASDLAEQAYDQLGQNAAGLDADGGLSRTIYDDAGNAVLVIDADGNQTAFVYDALNRVVKETSPTGGVTTTAYDAGGRETKLIDALGQEQDFSYDNAGRATQTVWKNTGGTAVNTLTYSYDNNGNELTAQDANGAYTYSYDELNRATVVQEPFGASLTYSYDDAGNNTLVQDSFGGTTSYVFDSANRVTSMQFGGTGLTPLRMDLAYNNRNQITTETRYKDLAGSNTVGNTTFAYDSAGRMTGITVNSTTMAVDSYSYGYDSADRLTSETSTLGATGTYTYDANGQLLGDGVHTYSYDAEGDRTMTGYTTGTGNQMTNDGTWTYTYDAKGELTKKSMGASATTWYYQYDDAGHLTFVSEHATDDGVNTADATYKEVYKYDVLGNRQEMDVYASGDSGGDTVTRFAYDLNGNAWADLNGSNSLTMRRLYLQATDALFARISSGGTAAWYVTDRLGSVRDITDNVNGSVLDHLDYDGYGNITTETNSGNGDRYKWTGRELDATTGLQYNRARYYDPKTGRWLSQDPMGFDAGDSNLYRYVNNRPTGSIDPSGLLIEDSSANLSPKLLYMDEVAYFYLTLARRYVDSFGGGKTNPALVQWKNAIGAAEKLIKLRDSGKIKVKYITAASGRGEKYEPSGVVEFATDAVKHDADSINLYWGHGPSGADVKDVASRVKKIFDTALLGKGGGSENWGGNSPVGGSGSSGEGVKQAKIKSGPWFGFTCCFGGDLNAIVPDRIIHLVPDSMGATSTIPSGSFWLYAASQVESINKLISNNNKGVVYLYFAVWDIRKGHEEDYPENKIVHFDQKDKWK